MQAYSVPGIQNLPLQRCVQQDWIQRHPTFAGRQQEWGTQLLLVPLKTTLDSNDTPEGSHFKHSTKNAQYTVLESWFFTATYHNLKLFSFFIFGIYK